MKEDQKYRINLESTRVNEQGEFEILAITAGEGNGWNFPAAALKDSMPLWDGVHTYIDHHWFGQSVHDLAGLCHSPEWDEGAQGVRLRLKPFGPAAPILTEMGKAILRQPEGEHSRLRPQIGFSADVMFTASRRNVQTITRVFSVDLVVNPARGGEFIREIVQKLQKEGQMEREKENQRLPAAARVFSPDDESGRQPALSDNHAGGSRHTGPEEMEALSEEVGKARALRVQICEQFLSSALDVARLPAPVGERLRQKFAGRLFEADEISSAIADARAMLSELTGAAAVCGPRIHSVFDTRDKLQAAVDDLLGAPRDKGAESIQPARLSGIRELYLTLTGDYDLHGGYAGERAALATTADFTGLVKNALNKIVVNTWDLLGAAGYDWWKKIVRTEHFNSLQSITGTLVGAVGALPSVAEGAEYTELQIGDSPETANFTKYGGYIPLTLELIDRDESRKLAAYPRELAAAGLRKISALVAAVFTDQAGVGPTLADGGALFNNSAVTSAGGHANLLTTALSAAQWDVVSSAVYNQPMLVKNAAGLYGSGPKMAINPRYAVVPRALQLTAMKVLYPSLENAVNIYSENMQRGQPGDVVVVPEWNDATDWAAVCDPLIAPAIFVGERFGIMPEIFISGEEQSPAVFMNDEHRLKVRHFLACWVNDFRPLHKSNVAG